MTFTARLGVALLAAGTLAGAPSAPAAQPAQTTPAMQGCVGTPGALGPVKVSPNGRISFAGAPLFSWITRFTPTSASLVRPRTSTYRLVVLSDGDHGPLEAAIVDFATQKVINPGLLGPSRTLGLTPARQVLQFSNVCLGQDLPADPASGWQSFGGDRFLAGAVTPMEGQAGLALIDLHRGTWAWWMPRPADYPRAPGKLPGQLPASEAMLPGPGLDRLTIRSIDTASGRIEAEAVFDFTCNTWELSEEECQAAGIPLYTGEADPGPRLSKTYRITLTLRR
jgi:hypothetical protein